MNQSEKIACFRDILCNERWFEILDRVINLGEGNDLLDELHQYFPESFSHKYSLAKCMLLILNQQVAHDRFQEIAQQTGEQYYAARVEQDWQDFSESVHVPNFSLADSIGLVHGYLFRYNLSGTSFSEMEICSTDVSSCFFTEAKIDQSTFRDCKFDTVDFSGSKISESYFENCSFTFCHFDHADMTKSMLEQCTFEHCTWERARISAKQVLPSQRQKILHAGGLLL